MSIAHVDKYRSVPTWPKYRSDPSIVTHCPLLLVVSMTPVDKYRSVPTWPKYRPDPLGLTLYAFRESTSRWASPLGHLQGMFGIRTTCVVSLQVNIIYSWKLAFTDNSKVKTDKEIEEWGQGGPEWGGGESGGARPISQALMPLKSSQVQSRPAYLEKSLTLPLGPR